MSGRPLNQDKQGRPKNGRPTVRVDPARERVLQALRLGATYRVASQAAGIHHATLERWRRDDEEFSAECERARGEMAMRMLARLEQASTEGTWQAAAWKLERLFPADYSLRRDNDGQPQEIIVRYAGDPLPSPEDEPRDAQPAEK